MTDDKRRDDDPKGQPGGPGASGPGEPGYEGEVTVGDEGAVQEDE